MFSKKNLTFLPPSFSPFLTGKPLSFAVKRQDSQESWWALEYIEIQLVLFSSGLAIHAGLTD